MTKEHLIGRIARATLKGSFNNAEEHFKCAESLSQISIEYAIDVLERMKEELRMGFPFADHDRISLWLTNKIDEEKNNLNH